MRGHWAYRSAAGLITGLFLLLTVGMGEATHICPVHDPMLAEMTEASSAQHGGGPGSADTPAGGMHTQHAQSLHAEMDAASSHGDHDSGHDPTHCCCTGFACVTNTVTLPAHRLELPTVALTAPAAPELPEYARSAAASAYYIPFANGPPTLSERSA